MVYAAVAAALFAALSFFLAASNKDLSTQLPEENLSSDGKSLSSKDLLVVALPGMCPDLINMVLEYCDVSQDETNRLLLLVARGEQDQAEAMIKESPLLVLEKGTVTDLSNRTFKDITAFQYALWARDWHMWEMLLKYLPLETAALQFQELEEKGTEHRKHFSLIPLIEMLDTYAKNCSFEKIKTRWIQQVGGAQLRLPAHVINEYCHPSRPFSPCPDFSSDVTLPRSMKINGGEWFTAVLDGGTLGIGYSGFFVSHMSRVRPGCLLFLYDPAGPLCTRDMTIDRDTLQSLLNTRQQQLLGLKDDLASRVEPMIGLGR